MKKRFLAMFLVLIMLVQLLPATVFAKENDGMDGGCVVSGGIHTNPLYENHRSPSAISPKYGSNYALPNNADYVSSPDEAAVIIRNAHEKRQRLVTFYYHSSTCPTEDMFDDIWERAFVETGVPTQGDYLRFLWDYSITV